MELKNENIFFCLGGGEHSIDFLKILFETFPNIMQNIIRIALAFKVQLFNQNQPIQQILETVAGHESIGEGVWPPGDIVQGGSDQDQETQEAGAGDSDQVLGVLLLQHDQLFVQYHQFARTIL